MEILINILCVAFFFYMLYRSFRPEPQSLDDQANEMFKKKIGTISVYIRLTREQFLKFLPTEPTILAPETEGHVLVAKYNLVNCTIAEAPDEHNPDEYSRTGTCYLEYRGEFLGSLVFSEYVNDHFDQLINLGAFRSLCTGDSDPFVRIKISQKQGALELPIPLLASIQTNIDPNGESIQLIGTPA